MLDKHFIHDWCDFFRNHFCTYCRMGGRDCYMDGNPHNNFYQCEDTACELFDLWLKQRDIEDAIASFELENGEDDDNPKAIALMDELDDCEDRYRTICQKFSRELVNYADENPFADIPCYAY